MQKVAGSSPVARSRRLQARVNMSGIFKFFVFLLLLGFVIKVAPGLIKAAVVLLIICTLLALTGLAYYVFIKGGKTKRGRVQIKIDCLGERCPHCQKPIEAGQIICTHCYEDLALNCPNCGEILSWREKSCPVCKTALRVTSRAR